MSARLLTILFVVAAVHTASTILFERTFGESLSYGAPRWRCALGVLFGCSLALVFYGAEKTRRSKSQRRSVFDLIFIVEFAYYLMIDFLIVELRTMLKVHHAVCLFGHVCSTYDLRKMARRFGKGTTIASFFHATAGFRWYFAGVTSFELGSASMNVMCVYPESTLLMMQYILVMTISNVCAVYCSYRWANTKVGSVKAFTCFQGAFGIILTITLAVMRQRKCMSIVNDWSTAV